MFKLYSVNNRVLRDTIVEMSRVDFTSLVAHFVLKQLLLH